MTRVIITISMLLALLGMILVWAVAGDPVSQMNWDRIQPGMTKTQVVSILGKPTSYDGNQLEYTRPLNAGWVEFAFNEKDVLVWKNDESVFGSLR